MPHFFISYAKKDTQTLAFALCDLLNDMPNMSAWVDRSLVAGRSWEGEIQREIIRCDVFVVLYSPDINRHLSNPDVPESYVLEEISYAKYVVKKPIIPVMAQVTLPPMGLARTHYIDFATGGMTLNQLATKILQEAGVNAPPPSPSPSKPATPLITPKPSKTRLDEALERARAFTGKKNRDWTPFITTLGEIDASTPLPELEMCLVPVGKFMMGSNDGSDDEEPPHEQVIKTPYWIARYPITNAQWRKGVEAGAVSEPTGSPGKAWYENKVMADCPVVSVTWFEVKRFVEWTKCALPTEPLWEYGARGVEGWVYPWGNTFDGNKVIYERTPKYGGNRPAPVTLLPEGASWVGAMHLSGNVWEWQLSAYAPYEYVADDGREGDLNSPSVRRVLRGGSFANAQSRVRSVYRNFPNFDNYPYGFRLCLSPIASLVSVPLS